MSTVAIALKKLLLMHCILKKKSSSSLLLFDNQVTVFAVGLSRPSSRKAMNMIAIFFYLYSQYV